MYFCYYSVNSWLVSIVVRCSARLRFSFHLLNQVFCMMCSIFSTYFMCSVFISLFHSVIFIFNKLFFTLGLYSLLQSVVVVVIRRCDYCSISFFSIDCSIEWMKCCALLFVFAILNANPILPMESCFPIISFSIRTMLPFFWCGWRVFA